MKEILICYIQLRAKMFIDSDFYHNYLHTLVDKTVNRMLIVINIGYLIAAKVWEMSIYKYSRNLNCLYIQKCDPNRAEK